MRTKTTPRPKIKQDDHEQSERFLKAAMDHGAATTEEEARRVFRKVAKSVERFGLIPKTPPFDNEVAKRLRANGKAKKKQGRKQRG